MEAAHRAGTHTAATVKVSGALRREDEFARTPGGESHTAFHDRGHPFRVPAVSCVNAPPDVRRTVALFAV